MLAESNNKNINSLQKYQILLVSTNIFCNISVHTVFLKKLILMVQNQLRNTETLPNLVTKGRSIRAGQAAGILALRQASDIATMQQSIKCGKIRYISGYHIVAIVVACAQLLLLLLKRQSISS